MEHGHLTGLEERLNFLKESQYWSQSQIGKFQFAETIKLLRHAKSHVRYYKSLFEDSGINIDAMRDFNDFRKIPMLDKETIKNRGDDFIADNYDRASLVTMTTGGSTGNPLKIFMDERFKSYNHANTYFYMDVLGYDPKKCRSVRLHGDIFPESKTGIGKLWEEKDRKLVMSSYHITEKTTPLYLSAIADFNPDYIHAYPSAIWLLSKYAGELNLPVPDKIKCIFCDSEKLYRNQKKFIEKIFSCPVFQVYGHTEGSVLGINCQFSEYIHMAPQIGYFELLNPDGTDVREEGAVGEIVVTGFNNYVMPFIRYRTGDYGTYTKQKCNCGRQWPLLLEVEGRKQDYLVDKSGKAVAVGPTIFDYNIDWSGVDKFQIFQNLPGCLTIKIKLLIGSRHDVRDRLRKTFQDLLGVNFNVDVAEVGDLQFTRIGKFRYIDQKLELDEYKSR